VRSVRTLKSVATRLVGQQSRLGGRSCAGNHAGLFLLSATHLARVRSGTVLDVA
jgi:hypothetical protein